jgi:RhtB (resistance to homoserine/threonine) family protein
MIDTTYWLVFLTAAVALNISPGPDLLYILSRTVAQGRRVGLASAAGVCTGAFVHVVAAALGLSAILATSAGAFNLVKYVGAAYLIYLGLKALRSAGTSFTPHAAPVPRVSAALAFRQGVLIDVLNPKVAIFFMAFLPQFVRPEAGNVTMQLLFLGSLVVGVAIIIESAFVLAAAKTTGFFRTHRKASVWLDRMMGSVLIALGVRLALSEIKH